MSPSYMEASLSFPMVWYVGFLKDLQHAQVPGMLAPPSPYCLISVPLVLLEALKTLYLLNPFAAVTIPNLK